MMGLLLAAVFTARLATGQKALDAREVTALRAFYTAANGPAWSNKDNWMQTTSPCDPAHPWHGVTCGKVDGQFVVRRVWLTKVGLKGTIPTELGLLKHVEWVNICRGQLSGTIPSELGAMTSVKHLYLILNDLRGAIPPSLGKLPKIQRLALAQNRLEGIVPDVFSKIKSLSYISIGDNQLDCPLPHFAPKQQRDPPLTHCVAGPRVHEYDPSSDFLRTNSLEVQGHNLTAGDKIGLTTRASCEHDLLPVGGSHLVSNTTVAVPFSAFLKAGQSVLQGKYRICYYRTHIYYMGWPFPYSSTFDLGSVEFAATATGPENGGGPKVRGDSKGTEEVQLRNGPRDVVEPPRAGDAGLATGTRQAKRAVRRSGGVHANGAQVALVAIAAALAVTALLCTNRARVRRRVY